MNIDKITEAHQRGEMETKDTLTPLRQPYTRLRDTFNGLNHGIPTRTRNVATSNLPFFETFIENLPTMGKH